MSVNCRFPKAIYCIATEFISLSGNARLFQHPVDGARYRRHGEPGEAAFAPREFFGERLHLRDVFVRNELGVHRTGEHHLDHLFGEGLGTDMPGDELGAALGHVIGNALCGAVSLGKRFKELKTL